MKTVLLTHFYNEEFLLPHWILHHKDMFDHVILIDYKSTDASCDIIKSMTNWEIRPSRNLMFDASQIDLEMMDIEKEFINYWKIVLNITEFIVVKNLDLKKYISQTIEAYPDIMGMACTGVFLVDNKENQNKPIDKNIPLILQRHNGRVGDGSSVNNANPGVRSRFLHRAETGRYSIGRHYNGRGDANEQYVMNDLFCVWFGFSPYYHIKQRKLQVKEKIPPHHFSMGWGVQHNLKGEKELDQLLQQWQTIQGDVFLNLKYYEAVKSIANKNNIPLPIN